MIKYKIGDKVIISYNIVVSPNNFANDMGSEWINKRMVLTVAAVSPYYDIVDVTWSVGTVRHRWSLFNSQIDYADVNFRKCNEITYTNLGDLI